MSKRIEVDGVAKLQETYVNDHTSTYSVVLHVDVSYDKVEPTRRKITVPIDRKLYDELRNQVSDSKAGVPALGVSGKLELTVIEADKDEEGQGKLFK